MSAIKARAALEQLGLPRERFDVLWKYLVLHGHDDSRGGQHTNGGCHGGRCDYGSEVCAAWTEMLDVLSRL